MSDKTLIPDNPVEPQAGGTSMADLLTEATWQTCVGMCIGGECKRLFISRERFDAHIAPLLRELAERRERDL